MQMGLGDFLLRILFWAAAAAILFVSPSFAEPGATGGDLGQVNKMLSGSSPEVAKPAPVAMTKNEPRQRAAKRESLRTPQSQPRPQSQPQAAGQPAPPPRQASQPPQTKYQRTAISGETCSSVQSICVAGCTNCLEKCLRQRNACIQTGEWRSSLWTVSGLSRQ